MIKKREVNMWLYVYYTRAERISSSVIPISAFHPAENKVPDDTMANSKKKSASEFPKAIYTSRAQFSLSFHGKMYERAINMYDLVPWQSQGYSQRCLLKCLKVCLLRRVFFMRVNRIGIRTTFSLSSV